MGAELAALGLGGGAAITIGSGGIATLGGVALADTAVVTGGVYIGAGVADVLDGVAMMMSQGSSDGSNDTGREFKKSKSKTTHRDKKDDVPSWAEGKRPYKNEDGKSFTKRLLDEKYGEGNYAKGAGSEYSEIQKWGNSGFE